MTKWFGANWWTTLWGFITAAAGAIAIRPELIAFLPDSWEPTVSGLALLVTVIAGGTFAVGVKSKNVTGGTVQQTVSGAAAEPTTQSLVDQTVIASIKSGDPTVTPEQKAAVQPLR
jgi:hypothetical protein